MQFPKHIQDQLTQLASTTTWARNPTHSHLTDLSPMRHRAWVRKASAGRKRAKGGLNVTDIPGRLAAAQADSVARLFDQGTGRWKDLLLHFLERASNGAPYGKDLLLSTIPTKAIQKAPKGVSTAIINQ